MDKVETVQFQSTISDVYVPDEAKTIHKILHNTKKQLQPYATGSTIKYYDIEINTDYFT